MNQEVKQSFTLVELLIVIAIIGILAAAVIFGVSSARDKAAGARSMSDCSSFVTAEQAYYGDKGQYDTSSSSKTCSSGASCCQVSSYLTTGVTPPAGWSYDCSGTSTSTISFYAKQKGATKVTGTASGCTQ